MKEGTVPTTPSGPNRLTYHSKPAEYMAMTDTYSPVLHRIDQAVRWRAVHPTEPIPPPYAILTKYSQQPEELQQKAKSSLAKLIAAADVKKGTRKSHNTNHSSHSADPTPSQSHPKSKAAAAAAKNQRPSPASSSPVSPPASRRKTPSPNSSKCSTEPRSRTTSSPRPTISPPSSKPASRIVSATARMRASWRR